MRRMKGHSFPFSSLQCVRLLSYVLGEDDFECLPSENLAQRSRKHPRKVCADYAELLGEQFDGLSGVSGDGSDLDLWNLGSVFLSISAADMRALVSERLPFFSSRALKLSLLVLLFRTLL